MSALQHIQDQIDLHDDGGEPIVVRLPKREWQEIARKVGEMEQWEDRAASFVGERVPMAACVRLLDIHTAATANAFRPDVPKAKRALHELIGRAMTQLRLLGD